METMLEILKQSGKSTARELAKILGIEPKEAVKELQSLQNKGLTGDLNGYWHAVLVSDVAAPSERAEPQKTGAEKIISLVNLHGPISAAELAAVVQLNPKSVASTLTHAFSAGRIQRTGCKGSYVYSSSVSGTKLFLNTIPRMSAGFARER